MLEEINDFSKIACTVGNVLIRPLRGNNELLIAGDKKLYLDTSFEKLRHMPVVGVVVAVPSQLLYSEKEFALSDMEWDTEMELKVGDIVNYHHLDMEKAITQDDFIIVSGQVYYPIPYHRIFCAKRKLPPGDRVIKTMDNFITDGVGHYQVIMLNGYILAEEVPEKVQTQLVLTQKMKDKYDAKYGLVRFIGSCNKRYNTPYPPDDDRLKIGMIAVLDPVCDVRLEYDLHAQFDGQAKYFRVQRRNIRAFINHNNK